MSVSSVDSMASLSSDLCYDILRRLDGATLAIAACTCAAFSSISKEERLWENVCSSMWPSTSSNDVKNLISSVGGFKKFYADCFPLIVNKEVPEFHWNEYYEYPQEWTEADYYGDEDEVENISPSDFVSIVDIIYKDKTVCSKVLWGIPYANGSSGWFYNCPFRIDLLANSARDDEPSDDIVLSLSDGLPLSWSIERERKDGKLWHDLRDGIRLSWILVNKKTKKTANLSSWSPIGGQRHWPTDKDFLIRFGSILPAKDILPCQVVECILIMKFKVVLDEDGSAHTTLKLSELSMQLGDMEGSHVNGRNSLLVLKEALNCPRSKNYSEALESCHLYSKVQSELKEEKMRYENRFDAKTMLETLRDRRIVFVGDSIGRNQWESLLCMLSSVIPNKTSVYEVNGSPITKHSGSLIFKFMDFNCTVEYYRAPFLVLQSRAPAGASESVRLTLKLDQMDWSSSAWKGADLLVFNTGHWWNYEKTIRGGCYFQEGAEIKMEMSVKDAFHRSVKTLSDWISREVNMSKAHLIFRAYAPVHFRGGDWRNGGSCHMETLPDLNSPPSTSEEYIEYKTVVDGLSEHLKAGNIELLNVTVMTSQRKDGHSSLYYLGPDGGPAAIHRQDCSHWCLPGVPDSWNELLYAMFLKRRVSHGRV